MDLLILFGKRLKQIRTDFNLTQEEFAFRCDMQASHIGQIERGEKNPTLITLNKIANGFNISLLELLNIENRAELPSDYDELSSKIADYTKWLSIDDRSQILEIVKTFVNRNSKKHIKTV